VLITRKLIYICIRNGHESTKLHRKNFCESNHINFCRDNSNSLKVILSIYVWRSFYRYKAFIVTLCDILGCNIRKHWRTYRADVKVVGYYLARLAVWLLMMECTTFKRCNVHTDLHFLGNYVHIYVSLTLWDNAYQCWLLTGHWSANDRSIYRKSWYFEDWLRKIPSGWWIIGHHIVYIRVYIRMTHATEFNATNTKGAFHYSSWPNSKAILAYPLSLRLIRHVVEIWHGDAAERSLSETRSCRGYW